MIGAAAGPLLGAMARAARAVPVRIWVSIAIAAVIVVAWRWDRAEQYRAGVDAEAARWAAAQAEADREAARAEARRDRTSSDISTQSDERATDAVVETRTETAAAVERVRYETQVIEVPVGCDRPLPVGVRDEFAKAIAAANAAGRQVRAERNP